MKEKVRRSYHLLIVDEYSSYMNMAFIATTNEQRIILLILSSYSTYCLQSLDVSLFSLLVKAYIKGLNNFMFHSLKLISMNKRLFWSLFCSAWDFAFIKKNIISSFKATGIFPFNLNRVLTILIIQKFVILPFLTTCTLTLSTPYAGRCAFQELRIILFSTVINYLECSCYECWPQCLESTVGRLLLNYTKLKKGNEALHSSRAYIHSGAIPNNTVRLLY